MGSGSRDAPPPGRLGALWRRLSGREPARALEKPVARVEPTALARFDTLTQCLRRELPALRRPRPSAVGNDRVASDEERLSVATAHAEQLRRDLESLAQRGGREQKNAEEWERLAELAVRAGDDDLARETLARAKEHRERAADLDRESETGRAVLAEIRATLDAFGRPPPGAT